MRVAGRREADVLVVASEPGTRACTATDLRLGGYRVTLAASGDDAVRVLGERNVNLIVVDVETEGLGALAPRTFADRPPVLCLTGCDGLIDLIPVLGTRVEDYVTKPCRAAELLARVQVALRGSQDHTLRSGDLLVDDSTSAAWRAGRALDVTPAEFRLLRFLVLNAGQVLSKDQLAWHVWGEVREGNTVERLVSRLRTKVDAVPPAVIRTHRGFGYRLAT
ncbi:response regulator transcription factor [Kineosporia sp. J2-2]|uniref:Response regulator transcription factor n=1 Tax=Kineosporia corallincola TaxID=2835133 RepID=A0ABS5TR83_9ACTN|nr:response regulator transcription factor [Kineosporia corallincola]MBT0773278.1 response regulator transcription factor [Kineosporia corallincola]